MIILIDVARWWTAWPTAWPSVPSMPVRSVRASLCLRAMHITVQATSQPGQSVCSKLQLLYAKTGSSLR